MTTAIEIRNLNKEFRLGTMNNLRQTLKNSVARITGRAVQERLVMQALRDINLTIESGEVVGIIGHNGAGKSTLLKMLANISQPTSGTVRTEGRIAPLIEVGAGFIPDFTGRENVYLNGAILGMKKAEIDAKFDEIVAFAEMERFIDTPVKRYSSGMQVKLAFAVATSIESEILIVDEVLAVGDLAFQRKCFDRMEDLIRRQGRTVLLVSHNLRHVERICSRVVLLDKGCILGNGPARDVCNQFYQISDARIASQKKHVQSSAQYRSSGEVELHSVEFFDGNDDPTEEIEFGSDLRIRITYDANCDLLKPVFVLGIHTTDFIYLGMDRSQTKLELAGIRKGRHTVECTIRRFPFLPGTYALRLDVIVGELYSTTFRADNIHPFKVYSKMLTRAETDAEGFVQLDTSWDVAEDEYATF